MAGALYERTPRLDGIRISTGNTAIDGTGSLTSIITGVAAPGTRVKPIWVQPIATITDGWVAFFIYNGSVNRLFGPPLLFSAYTVVAGTKPPMGKLWIPPQDLVLPSTSFILKACPYNSESFDLFPNGSDFV